VNSGKKYCSCNVSSLLIPVSWTNGRGNKLMEKQTFVVVQKGCKTAVLLAVKMDELFGNLARGFGMCQSQNERLIKAWKAVNIYEMEWKYIICVNLFAFFAMPDGLIKFLFSRNPFQRAFSCWSPPPPILRRANNKNKNIPPLPLLVWPILGLKLVDSFWSQNVWSYHKRKHIGFGQ